MSKGEKKTKEQMREYWRVYHSERRKTGKYNYSINVKNSKRRQRIRLLELLGNKCMKCGFNDSRALQIDHIKGGGNKERKLSKSKDRTASILKEATNDINKFFNKYQLLCANCNWIKKYENKEF